MRLSTRVLAALVIPAAALAALATSATAGDVATFGTRVTISSDPPAFHGRVFSDADVCREQRRVKLLRRTRPGRPVRVLGTDRTEGNGRWAITEPDDFTLRSGIYWARAPRKIVETPVPTICARDRSRRLVVD